MSAEAIPFEIMDLSYRFSDRLEVTLWWVRDTIESFVEVVDHRLSPPASTIVPVPVGASANDVFYHPFSYEAKMPEEVEDGRGSE